jgi:large subunit ribosomal protein L31
MKEGIHPAYGAVTVECACGNSFVTRSTTAPRIRLEICSQCHPFYTGQQRLVDTAGRVERFEKRYAKTGGQTVVRKPAAVKPAVVQAAKTARKVLRTTPVALPKPKKAPKKDKAPKADKPAAKPAAAK